MQNKFFSSLALLALFALPCLAETVAAPSAPLSEKVIFIRANTGPTFYSNTDPIDSGWGLGLDIGFRSSEGFGLAARGKFNLQKTGYVSTGGSSYLTPRLRTLFFGIEPSYGVSKGILNLSFGLAIGALATNTDTTTYNGVTSINDESSQTRFAIMPSVHLDFTIFAGLFAGVGLEYLTSFGSSPSPAFFQPNGAVGYQF